MLKSSKYGVLVLLLMMVSVTAILAYAPPSSEQSVVTYPQIDLTDTLRRQQDTRPVETHNTAALDAHGFELVAANDRLALYVEETVFNIAVYDIEADYVWYGFYPDYESHGYTERLNQLIRSGITVDFFDAITLNEATLSIGHADAMTEMTYTPVHAGLDVHIDLVSQGISFRLELRLEAASLAVRIPYESIQEVPFQTAAMRVPRERRLRAISVFPYFGSANHEINGYALIPDGSGALIDYTNITHRSAYIRRVFGRDNGIQSMRTVQAHLRPEEQLTLPLFGINHGFEQAAFLAEAISGYGALELHSYPYGYNNTRINTTFFSFIVRDRTLIQMSGQEEGLAIINQQPYPHDMVLRYTFLEGDRAHYAGMAEVARERFAPLAEQRVATHGVGLHLEALGIDYKPGLLGKTYVPLTSYDAVMSIHERLDAEGIARQAWVYRGYNRGGYYGNTPIRFQADRRLGGRRALTELIESFAASPTSHVALVDNPMMIHDRHVFTTVLHRTALDLFRVPVAGALIDHGYYVPIEGFAERLLGHRSRPTDVMAFALDTVGQSHFSYRLSGETVYREAMIQKVIQELEAFEAIELGLYQPAGYAFPYLTRYYDLALDSNRLTFFTRTVPFVSLMLHGHVELYGPFINYVNDLETFALRLIEFGAWPAALITEAASYQLRFTNYEPRMTTEFALWESEILMLHQKVADVLEPVVGVPIQNHEILSDTVVKVTYANGFILFINYGLETFVYDDQIIVPARDAKAVGP